MEQLSFWALFHLSFSLKVIACLQRGPWNFWKLQIYPYHHLPLPALLPVAGHRQRRPPTPFPAIPAINPPCAGTHASRTSSSPACCLALEPPPLATHPRRAQNLPGGRHRDVAVESPNQRPSSRSFARLSTTRHPGFDFTRSFALSSLPRCRTPPPPRLNPGEPHPTAEPPTQTRSTPTSPTISTASTSRSS